MIHYWRPARQTMADNVAPVQRWESPFTPVLLPNIVNFGDRWFPTYPADANALFLSSGKFGQVSAADTSAR